MLEPNQIINPKLQSNTEVLYEAPKRDSRPKKQRSHLRILILTVVITFTLVSVPYILYKSMDTDVGKELAKPDTIQISGLDIKNIYRNRIYTADSGDLIFFRNEYSEFSYLPEYDQFIIHITKSPTESFIPLAETEFLQILEVDTSTACKLNVEVGIPLYVDNRVGGGSYPLSFCKS